jgi:hypothetical protein
MAYMRQRGLSAYDHSGDWTWEFYPPPYDFLAPADSAAIPAPILLNPGSRGGLSGGCGCGGSCGGCGGSHSHGMGLFDTGLDLTGWGMPEYAIVGIGLYALFKIIGDTKRVSGAVRKSARSRSAKAARRAKLQQELSSL